jgi:hypothetical protein
VRRVVALTPDRLDQLAETLPCGSCAFWELDPVRRARVDSAAEAREEKHAWLSLVLREWGSCGRVVLVDDVVVGYATYAPPAFVPGASAFPTAPVSADAVLLTTVRVAPGHTGGGLGRVLVQTMARDLVQRGGVRAVEAFASRSGTEGCVVPADFLGHVGFRTHRPHLVTPRMRMDLRSALTWRDEVEAAVERLVGAVGPRGPVPETAYGVSTGSTTVGVRRTPRAP